jgi:hypothetical protein
MRAMLLVRRGGALAPALATAIRDKGFEPFVLSSRPFGDGARFHAMLDDIGVEHAISPNVGLTEDEVVERARGIEDCAFALTVADSQRVAMAAANRAIGACDITPAAATLALDKHLLRTKLLSCGLSRLDPYRLTDPRLRARLDRGERFIVKPRRGVSSLCVGIATSWPDVAPLAEAFARGPGDGDMLEEYFVGNELVAETFFDGEELSIDVVRQSGANRLTCAHGKAGLEFRDGTVLELGHVSPPVNVTDAQTALVTAFATTVLDTLELTDGCYHVEVRINADDECELIEINPRVPGHLLWDSIRLQHDNRSIIDDWMDVLTGKEVRAPGEPVCGTYMEVAYPRNDGGQVIGVRLNPRHPAPIVDSIGVVPGMPEIEFREEPAAEVVWTTDRAQHADQVAVLMAEPYVQFVYAKPVSAPVTVALEPAATTYGEASDVDWLIIAQGDVDMTQDYQRIMDRVTGIGHVADWTDRDSAVAAVLAAIGGSPVAQVLAGTPQAQAVAEAVRAKLG